MPTNKKKTPPLLPLMSLIESMGDAFPTLSRASQRFPDILMTGLPWMRVYMVNHPELAQHVLQKNYRNYTKGKGYEVLALLLGNGLITNDGDNWHKQRTLIQPAFHRGMLKRVSEIITKSTNDLLNRWKQKEGSTINFTRDMAELTIDIVAKSLFTTDVTPEHVQTIWRNVNFLNEASERMLRNPFHLPWAFPTPRYIKMRKYIAELDDIVFGIINRRKQEQNPPQDLLQLLLEARYEDTGGGMTDRQIRDEVMTIFLAGHETTVNALSWTWYLLKKNKPEEEKLRVESIKFALNRDPAMEDLAGLNYGRQVMNESMRMYPPVPVIARNSVNADEVGGYWVKGDRDVAVNIAGIHHHPAYWPDPYRFKPERFANFDLKGENRFIFMPFGAGPRICIGNNFAMMEMQMINAMLSARVDMELVSHEVKPVALITLKPLNGVVMKLNKVNMIAVLSAT